MRVENKTTGHSRTLRFTELPQSEYNHLPELLTEIGYSAPEAQPCEANQAGRLAYAMALDAAIIPGILAAVNNAAPEENTFSLKISLGNDTMRTPEDVGRLLEDIARWYKNGGTPTGPVYDRDGNAVGSVHYHCDGE